ncbi:MAG: thioesterase [Alteromonadaceae bacterium]|nr:thioesterase [Alteromonadaceae bacterium]
MLNKWFVIPKPNANADIRLICFPYAGGSPSTFISWAKDLPDNVELVIVQAPGRGARMFEPAYSDMNILISDLMKIFPRLLNKPYVLFGHSLGSRIAFELMNQLKMLNFPQPKHFIASGSKGPHIKSDKKPTYHLPQDEFITELKELSGTPEGVLENKELMEIFLPLLRADFEIAHKYCYAGKTIFNCPISVLGGDNDEDISLLQLNCWDELFTTTADVHLVPGNHFFIDSNKEMVLEKVVNIMKASLNDLALMPS